MDITDNKVLGYLGISGIAGYAGHEYAHIQLAGGILGQPEILSVSAAMVALAFAGIWILEADWHDSLPSLDSDVGKVGAIGALSFGAIHQLTHGELGASLGDTSLFLAAVAVVGMVAHEKLRKV
jgi:hypothetical protein